MTERDPAPEPAVHDPGGKVSLPLREGVRGGAYFYGPGDMHRLSLWRAWGSDDAPYALWVGMNPSMARGDVDDPTVRKEQEFTRRMGLTSYAKVNVMSYRSTSPQALRLVETPSPPVNLTQIAHMARGPECARVILACGNPPHPSLRVHYDAAFEALAIAGATLWCLGVNEKTGMPRHPLYVAYATPLVPYDPARSLRCDAPDA